MRQQMAKALAVISITTILLVISGCGSKGDLYTPNESQSTEK